MDRLVVEGNMWGGLVQITSMQSLFYQLAASPVASEESLERDTLRDRRGRE